ncbi:NADPH:quinone reductase [Mangrovimicrobium sediminis]|uniref:NADPH:quinone reductase n=1 Tax=Mangrovimicrobium sediminis TaxID=2562682 RepID=A0A4Z0LXK2_9GAMM|nr:zinc-dependent alcohol dehydrogenase family protein [Haliea sp. SAOS-164]TGD71805.1 NADPH:quinone reductase [Haliea sp. SAOS-164]
MIDVVRFHRTGGPEVLQIEQSPAPRPGPGEVSITVEAIGLNRVESMFRSGGFGAPQFPSTIGYEAAGRIQALGEGVEGWSVGERVATLPGLSMEQYGTCAEVILYPANMLVRSPDNQSAVEAAATWMQYLTAYALVAVGRVAAGDTVVITAASSSVGLAAIQIARAEGAVPIAVTRGRGKAQRLLEQGAAHVIVSDEQDVPATIMEITDGAGAALVFDAVGGQALAGLIGALQPRGTVILYGELGGTQATLPLQPIMFHGLTLRGYAAYELFLDPALREAAIDYIRNGLASGKLQPLVDSTFPLAEVVEAYRYLEGNTQLGKIVLTVN